MVESLGSWWPSLTHRNDDDEHDADDDTLDDATNALLSMLPLASIVVDEHDEVIRAHPSAPPRMLRNIRRKQASFPLAKPRNRR